MQAEKQRAWKIKVHARAKKFHFKFKATKTDQPTWKLPKFSIFLRIHKFFLQVDTVSGTSIPRWEKPRTLKSKFLSFFQKFKTLHSKKLTIAAGKTQNVQNPDSKLLVDQQGEFSYKRPFCIGSLLVGILALLSESICEKNKKGIIFHGSFILLYIAFLFKKYITGKAMTSLVFLTIATTVCAVMFRSDKYMDYDQGLVSEFVWKAWNYAASSGCLYELSQVIFSRFAKPWVRCSQSPNNCMT
ncbi:hypothetical protein OIU76_030554 [Salix suchowensis]|nr:hypothetical protein OIU76_030554 [Salix suchowensis]KAJ6365797.1 hypothetical protein OIU76_030554 [Salix suchowensis]